MHTDKKTKKLRLSEETWLDMFFNGAPCVDQVKGVTRGEVYNVIEAGSPESCEDVAFINDDGEIQHLASFFFEKVDG